MAIKDSYSKDMGRYLLFSWANYYPSGAKYDMKASSDNLYELKHYAYDELDSYYQHHIILDMDERKWINLEDI